MNNSHTECWMPNADCALCTHFRFSFVLIFGRNFYINVYIVWFFFSSTIRWSRFNSPPKVSNKRRCATSLSTFCSRHVLATDIKLFAHRSNSPSSKNCFLPFWGNGLLLVSTAGNVDLAINPKWFWQSAHSKKENNKKKSKQKLSIEVKIKNHTYATAWWTTQFFLVIATAIVFGASRPFTITICFHALATKCVQVQNWNQPLFGLSPSQMIPWVSLNTLKYILIRGDLRK